MRHMGIIKQIFTISLDLKSTWKSLWLGPLLIVWHFEYLDRLYPVSVEYSHGWYWEYMIEDLEASE